MPDQPGEDTYRAAAQALVTAQGGHMAPRTRDTLAAGWVRRDDFRAAVDEAWRAGRDSIASRVVWLDENTATVDRSVVCG